MSNPTFRTGPITCAVKTAVDKFHVVALDADGIAPAGAAGPVFGAVSENGAPTPEPEGNTFVAVPNHVAVHVSGALPLTATSGAAITAGVDVFAAASGEVADTGTVRVGVALGAPDSNDLVRVLLTGPATA